MYKAERNAMRESLSCVMRFKACAKINVPGWLFFVFFITAYCPLQLTAQSNAKDSSNRYLYKHRMDTLYFKQDALRFNYLYNGGHGISVGYNCAKVDYGLDVPVTTSRMGPTVSVGALWKENELFFSSGVGAAAHWYILYAGLESTLYTNFSNSSVFIVPEIGLSLGGWAYLGYSRNIGVVDNCNLRLTNQLHIGFFLALKKTNRNYYINGRRAEWLDRR